MTKHELGERLLATVFTLGSITINWIDAQIIDFVSNLNPVIIDSWVQIPLHLLQAASATAGLFLFLKSLFKKSDAKEDK